MQLRRQNNTVRTDISVIWMSFFRVSTSSTSTTKTIPSQWRVSTLICAIISPRWHGVAGAFPESWKISRLSLLFLSVPTTALASKKIASVPVTRGLKFPFLSLISFNCAIGHSLEPLFLALSAHPVYTVVIVPLFVTCDCVTFLCQA